MVIVGLAPTVRHELFKNRPKAHIYVPSGAADSTRMFVYARAAAPQTGDAIVRSVREQLRAADANRTVCPDILHCGARVVATSWVRSTVVYARDRGRRLEHGERTADHHLP
jgi:hypothetical protein